MTSAETASVRSGLQRPPGRVNIALAGLAVMVLLFAPLFQNPGGESGLAAMAAIFAVAVVLEKIADHKLRSIAFDTEIEDLLLDARKITKDEKPSTAADFPAMIRTVSLFGAGLCWLAGLIMTILPSSPPHSLWSAVVGVLIGEAIYLSGCFEQAAKQAELEQLALGWKAKIVERHDLKLGPSWAERAIELSDALERLPSKEQLDKESPEKPISGKPTWL